MDELEQVRAAAGPCLTCGEQIARPIVHGTPSALEDEPLEGHVVFAGCCIPWPAPAYSSSVRVTTPPEAAISCAG